MDPIYTGTVGMPIRLTLFDRGTVHDPRTATVRQITIAKPSGAKLVRTASVGTDSQGRSCLEYVTVDGDLDQAGTYTLSAYIEDAAGKWPSSPVKQRVYDSMR